MIAMSGRSLLGERPADEHDGELVRYCANPLVSEDALNSLFAASWQRHVPSDFTALHRHSLTYICAFDANTLIGYVNLAWDGGLHAFLLDTTVHPDWRGRGIGRGLVQQAAEAARERGVEWLHVDYEPHLAGFYRACGFRPTTAGLIHLGPDGDTV
jgi:GNAT superfamily N-acetyltransferase